MTFPLIDTFIVNSQKSVLVNLSFNIMHFPVPVSCDGLSYLCFVFCQFSMFGHPCFVTRDILYIFSCDGGNFKHKHKSEFTNIAKIECPDQRC